MTTRRRRFAEVLITWIVLRLLWGPCNVFLLVLACVWAFEETKADTAWLARGLFGALGTAVLAVTLYATHPAFNEVWDWAVVASCFLLYVGLALLLKLALQGREARVFTLR